jgi:hypothetical protein
VTHLPHQQARRGKKVGVARLALSADKREQAIELNLGGMKQKEIAVMLGVSDRTIRNWFLMKSGNEPISDSSPLSGTFGFLVCRWWKIPHVPLHSCFSIKSYLF